MDSSLRRDRLATFEELLEAQRKVVPRCSHCGDSCADRARDQALALEAMRTHIRVLEAAWTLELESAAKA
jgi:hypothetical protein